MESLKIVDVNWYKVATDCLTERIRWYVEDRVFYSEEMVLEEIRYVLRKTNYYRLKESY